jgi:hypothetical protein
MKKIILIVAFIAQFTYSQDIKNCKFDYTIVVSEILNKENPKNKLVNISYDFSKVKSKEAIITIEIVPILDCFNELEAKQLKEIIVISSKEENFKKKNSIILEHLKINSKCFKYRVILKSNCEEKSSWQYYTFIK